MAGQLCGVNYFNLKKDITFSLYWAFTHPTSSSTQVYPAKIGCILLYSPCLFDKFFHASKLVNNKQIYFLKQNFSETITPIDKSCMSLLAHLFFFEKHKSYCYHSVVVGVGVVGSASQPRLKLCTCHFVTLLLYLEVWNLAWIMLVGRVNDLCYCYVIVTFFLGSVTRFYFKYSG